MTRDKFCRLALELTGLTELNHMGHPDFPVKDRIIASPALLKFLSAGDKLLKHLGIGS